MAIGDRITCTKCGRVYFESQYEHICADVRPTETEDDKVGLTEEESSVKSVDSGTSYTKQKRWQESSESYKEWKRDYQRKYMKKRRKYG